MPDSSIEEIKQRLNVSDVISEYIKLIPSGSNYKARCPFHNDKTPSFMVSDDKQIWHCFGCGRGGDIFSFIQEIEGVEFPEALKILAKKAGVKLSPVDPVRQSQKMKILEINKWAAAYYLKILQDSPKAKIARDYLKKRKIEETTIEEFKIGYALEEWDALNKFLQKKGYKEEDIFQAGLSIRKQKGVGYFDRFRGRLMFPIFDPHDSVIGFSGRILKEREKEAKYINTPQTLAYNKSQTLYGINRAKAAIKEKKLAIVVEGNMDVLSSHQVGVKNVVASSGTALTKEQIQLLRRYSNNIAFCFDQDAAGQEATQRGLEQVLSQDINIKIIRLPFGKDPDECIRKDPKLWQKAAKEALSVMDYFFDFIQKNYDLSKIEDKKLAAKLLLPLIGRLFDPIEQSHYLQKLSGLIKVDEEILREQIAKIKEKKYSSTGEDLGEKKGKERKKERILLLSERVLGLGLKFPDRLSYIIEKLPEEAVHEDLKPLYRRLKIYYNQKQQLDFEDFLKQLKEIDSSLISKIDLIILLVEKDFSEVNDADLIKREIEKALKELKSAYIRKRLKAVSSEMKSLEEVGKDFPEKLIQEFNFLTEELKKLG